MPKLSVTSSGPPRRMPTRCGTISMSPYQPMRARPCGPSAARRRGCRRAPAAAGRHAASGYPRGSPRAPRPPATSGMAGCGCRRRSCLGEEHDRIALLQPLRQCRVRLRGVRAPRPVDEDRALQLRHEAEQGPALDLGLGDEGQRRDGADGEDVEPGDMVGEDQHGPVARQRPPPMDPQSDDARRRPVEKHGQPAPGRQPQPPADNLQGRDQQGDEKDQRGLRHQPPRAARRGHVVQEGRHGQSARRITIAVAAEPSALR